MAMTDAPKNRNKSEARLRVVNDIGDLYAAASASGLWIKIGFSTQLADRLKALNYDFASDGPFHLIGSTKSTYRVEQQLHRAMKSLHTIRIGAGKELYPASPAVRAIAEAVVAEPTCDPFELDDLLDLRRWCRAQSRLAPNVAVARKAHAPRIAELEEASARYYARVLARIAARRAAA